MTTEQYLLICLAEEATEVAQAATKALRFGLKSQNPYNKESNEISILNEYYDLISIMETLQQMKILPELDSSSVEVKINNKWNKIEKQMDKLNI